MPVQMGPERFEDLVSEALDLIPPDLAAAMDNVVVLVADRHPQDPGLLGLYEGIALTERDSSYAGALPDTVTIFRESLLEICETEQDVVEEALQGVFPLQQVLQQLQSPLRLKRFGIFHQQLMLFLMENLFLTPSLPEYS
jgi:predicted Zn-dependent protease with MMP-like domain